MISSDRRYDCQVAVSWNLEWVCGLDTVHLRRHNSGHCARRAQVPETVELMCTWDQPPRFGNQTRAVEGEKGGGLTHLWAGQDTGNRPSAQTRSPLVKDSKMQRKRTGPGGAPRGALPEKTGV